MTKTDKALPNKLVDAILTGDVALADKCDEGVTVIGSGTSVIPEDGQDGVLIVADTPEGVELMVPARPKRGKDIKKFSDLPLDVKRTIVRLTTNPDGSIDHEARAKRIVAAIHYQHYFTRPDTIRQEYDSDKGERE